MSLVEPMKDYLKGHFHPENPEKYAGNINEIVYRSSWELQTMVKFDRTESVILWNSEGLAIPYQSPLDGKVHRYFPDFLIRVRDKAGKERTYLLEIKPFSQTRLRTTNRNTKKYLTEVATYAVNQAKWKAAEEFCKDQGWEFQVITERDHPFV